MDGCKRWLLTEEAADLIAPAATSRDNVLERIGDVQEKADLS